MTALLTLLTIAAAAGKSAAADVTLGQVLAAAVPTAVSLVVVALVRVTYGKIDESIKGLGARVDALLEQVSAGRVADAELRTRVDTLEREVGELRRRRRA